MTIYSGFSPSNMVIFHGYVKLPEGISQETMEPSNWEGSWEKTCSDLARLALTAAGLTLAMPLVSLGLDSGSGIINWINW